MLGLSEGFKGDSSSFAFRDDFFPDEIISILAKNVSGTQERKREFKLGNIPSDMEALSEAIKIASEHTKINFNTAILKEYRPGESSGAYEWHIDPMKFLGGPLGICTLEGESELGIRDGKGLQVDITTITNRLILADSRLEHKASPPTNESGKRSFLFLGVGK